MATSCPVVVVTGLPKFNGQADYENFRVSLNKVVPATCQIPDVSHIGCAPDPSGNTSNWVCAANSASPLPMILPSFILPKNQ